jgi:hypothetical protein
MDIKNLKVSELKEILIEEGIDFPSNAKKAALIEIVKKVFSPIIGYINPKKVKKVGYVEYIGVEPFGCPCIYLEGLEINIQDLETQFNTKFERGTLFITNRNSIYKYEEKFYSLSMIDFVDGNTIGFQYQKGFNRSKLSEYLVK